MSDSSVYDYVKAVREARSAILEAEQIARGSHAVSGRGPFADLDQARRSINRLLAGMEENARTQGQT